MVEIWNFEVSMNWKTNQSLWLIPFSLYFLLSNLSFLHAASIQRTSLISNLILLFFIQCNWTTFSVTFNIPWKMAAIRRIYVFRLITITTNYSNSKSFPSFVTVSNIISHTNAIKLRHVVIVELSKQNSKLKFNSENYDKIAVISSKSYLSWINLPPDPSFFPNFPLSVSRKQSK